MYVDKAKKYSSNRIRNSPSHLIFRLQIERQQKPGSGARKNNRKKKRKQKKKTLPVYNIG